MKITPDLRSLAQAVLVGDVSAAGPFIDACLEDWVGDRERVTKSYVQRVEDTLHAFKTALVKGEKSGKFITIPEPLVAVLLGNYFNLEREARTLNRQGLS